MNSEDQLEDVYDDDESLYRTQEMKDLCDNRLEYSSQRGRSPLLDEA